MSNFISGTLITQTNDFTRTSLANIAELAANPRIGAKETAPWFCPHNGEAKTKEAAQVAQFLAVIIDLDDGDWTAERLLAALPCAFLAWTSSSHMQQKRDEPPAPRWKVLVPLAEPAAPEAWLKLAEGACIAFDADEAQARLQQVSYLPNKLIHDAPYEHVNVLDRPLLDADTASAWIELAESQAAAKQAAKKPTRKTQEPQSANIIRLANEAYSVRSLLEANGYLSAGSRYLSPTSESGMPGVVILDDGRMYSHGTNDALCDGNAHDAFDLLVRFRFGGDISRAIRELAEELDSEGQKARRANHAGVHPHTSPANGAWNAPEPLSEEVKSEPYPIEALPPVIQAAVLEVQTYMQAPLAMVATSALAVSSACVQGRVDVKRDERLRAPTSLFSLIVAESGERKSSVDNLFMKPVHDYDGAARSEGAKSRKKYDSELALWNVKHKALEATLSKAVKEGAGESEARKAFENSTLAQPLPPKTPSLLLDDATPEAVIQSLVYHWPIGFLATSEGGSFLGGHGMNTESVMRNLAMFNSRWDGSRSKVSRSKQTPIEVDGVRLAACVMVQPTVLKAFFEQVGEVARGSGFLARFLICWPESTQGDRKFVKAGEMHALAELHARMTTLLNSTPPPNELGQVEPFTLGLSGKAFEAWVNVYNAIERNLKAHGEYADIRDSASKAADNLARIAAVLHEIEGRMGAIEPDLIEAAAKVVLWHLSETQRMYANAQLSPTALLAGQLEAWLILQGGRYQIADILKFAPSRKLRRKAARDRTLNLLAELGRARVVEGVVEINPALIPK